MYIANTHDDEASSSTPYALPSCLRRCSPLRPLFLRKLRGQQSVTGFACLGLLRLYLFLWSGSGGSLFGFAWARPCLFVAVACAASGSPPGPGLACRVVVLDRVMARIASRCLGHIGSRYCDKDWDISSDCYCLLCSGKNRPEPTARLRPAIRFDQIRWRT